MGGLVMRGRPQRVKGRDDGEDEGGEIMRGVEEGERSVRVQ